MQVKIRLTPLPSPSELASQFVASSWGVLERVAVFAEEFCTTGLFKKEPPLKYVKRPRKKDIIFPSQDECDALAARRDKMRPEFIEIAIHAVKTKALAAIAANNAEERDYQLNTILHKYAGKLYSIERAADLALFGVTHSDNGSDLNRQYIVLWANLVDQSNNKPDLIGKALSSNLEGHPDFREVVNTKSRPSPRFPIIPNQAGPSGSGT